jgi:flagellar biosynthesis/type III secretory pathway chaperone
MNKRDCYLGLGIMLDAELAHTDALIALLRTESKILPKDADALLELSEQKNSLLKKLEQCHVNRNSLIQSVGYNADHEGFESCIAWCDHNDKLHTKWTNFMEQVKTCRTLNQLNGSVMDSSLRVVKQALSILYGQQLYENTYDANGQAQSANMGRSIAKA